MKLRTLHWIILILIAGFSGYYFGITKVGVEWKNYKPQISAINKEPPATGLRTVDFSPFWIVWDKLQVSYYDKTVIDPQKLLNGAISGMVESLGDPYTVYLPPVQNNSFKEGMAGQFQGIGAELGMRDKQIIVVAPLAGSPAEKAGIKIGDAILKVNDANIAGWTLAQAVEKIRGPKGTEVSLLIVHKDESESRVIKISRDTITVKSVVGWVKSIKDIEGVKLADAQKDKGIVYIRLSQFGDNTNQEFLDLTNKIFQDMKTHGNVKGIVFDLRNNPGGYLTDATFVASEFLPKGTLVVTQDSGSQQTPMQAQRDGLLLTPKLVVLINKGSASASEIVAGALRDHKRAKLIGDVSFGKGTIQAAEDLGGGSGLHVTIAKWLTPSGTWVHGKGLTPDITVAFDEKDPSHDVQLEKAIETLLQ